MSLRVQKEIILLHDSSSFLVEAIFIYLLMSWLEFLFFFYFLVVCADWFPIRC